MSRIAICAPARPITHDDAARVQAIAADFPGVELHFNEQCFASAGHFAGDDETRLAAFLACANDPAVDTVWFARGGYGSNRIAEEAMLKIARPAVEKTYLGYSDNGYLLAALYRERIGRAVHAPMPVDIRRDGGEAAIRRVFSFLSGDTSGLEPSLDDRPTVAFNLTTLATLMGTSLAPCLNDHVVMIEEVSEHLYALDRLLFHITSQVEGFEAVAGLRLGRISEVPENDRPFGASAEQIARDWCRRAGIAFLGTADIGHDAANKIVPFGVARAPGR